MSLFAFLNAKLNVTIFQICRFTRYGQILLNQNQKWDTTALNLFSCIILFGTCLVFQDMNGLEPTRLQPLYFGQVRNNLITTINRSPIMIYIFIIRFCKEILYFLYTSDQATKCLIYFKEIVDICNFQRLKNVFQSFRGKRKQVTPKCQKTSLVV